MKTEICQRKIDDVLEMLDDNNLGTLDINQIKQTILLMKNTIISNNSELEELNILRQDYIQRLSGMLKAIAAVSRNKEETEEILNLIESFEQMPAMKLISIYRKVSAKFRNAFPTSFGITNQYSPKNKSYAEYK
ncbi:MAG: hypothetical protein U9N54_05410 [candidate division Zixibacteria bacterium]|nr:hypothetical protein [candidate division Zixibacteria bacterium]